MEWLLDGSGIRRLDVAVNRLRRLQTLYKYKVGSSMDQAVIDRLRTVSQSIVHYVFLSFMYIANTVVHNSIYKPL